MCCRSLLFSSKLPRTAWLRAKSRLAKPSGANSARRPGQCNSTQTWHKRKKAPCSRCNAPAKTSQKAQRKASPILLQNPTVGSLCFPKLSTAISECVEESQSARTGKQWKQDSIKVSDNLFPRQIRSGPFFRCLFLKSQAWYQRTSYESIWHWYIIFQRLSRQSGWASSAIWLPDSLSGQDHRANLLVKQTKAVNTHARTCNRQQML